VLRDPVGRAASLQLQDVSTGRQAVLSAGGRSRAPICLAHQTPTANSVPARKDTHLPHNLAPGENEVVAGQLACSQLAWLR
jgi:hypothetical protein